MARLNLHMQATQPSIEEMKDELIAAGWHGNHSRNSTYWISPWGGWYLGPYGAWKVMRKVYGTER